MQLKQEQMGLTFNMKDQKAKRKKLEVYLLSLLTRSRNKIVNVLTD